MAAPSPLTFIFKRNLIINQKGEAHQKQIEIMKNRKEDILNAKVNKTFVTPLNREYIFNYRKVGNKYIYIISFEGNSMQIKESDYNLNRIDLFIDAIIEGLKIK